MATLAYTDLYKYVQDDLPGMTGKGPLLRQIRQAARRLCSQSEAWHEEVLPIAGVNYQRDYSLSHEYGTDVTIHRIRKITCNGIERDESDYEWLEDATLRFKSERVPFDLDNMLLTCGTCGETTASNWAAITDGAVGITIDSTAYDVESLNFMGVTTMDAVALVIQTGLRAEIDSNLGHVRYNNATDKFVVWVESGDLSYLTAGASGTDISGAAYMNGLTGTGVLSGWIIAHLVFLPNLEADSNAEWFLKRYAETIYSGAMDVLLRQPKKTWTNIALADDYRDAWYEGTARAKGEGLREHKTKDSQVEYNPGFLGE